MAQPLLRRRPRPLSITVNGVPPSCIDARWQEPAHRHRGECNHPAKRSAWRECPANSAHRHAVTIAWIEQALVAGGLYELPHIKTVTIEEVGAATGLLAEILRCRLT